MPRYHTWITVPTGGTPTEEEIPIDIIEEETIDQETVEEETISTDEVPILDMTQLVPVKYDSITLAYSGDLLKAVRYRVGGRKGKIVAKLSLIYDNDEHLHEIWRTEK